MPDAGSGPRPADPEPRSPSASTAGHHRRASRLLRDLLDSLPGETMRLDELIRALGDRAFGLVLLVFALPNLVPLPIPGLSTVLGLPLVLFAGQLMLGHAHPWVPRRLANVAIRRRDLARAVTWALPRLERLERRVRPRATNLVQGRAEQGIGLACLMLSLVLILPIALVNLLPAIAIAVLAVSLLEHDGRLALLGYALGLASLLAAAALAVLFAGLLVAAWTVAF